MKTAVWYVHEWGDLPSSFARFKPKRKLPFRSLSGVCPLLYPDVLYCRTGLFFVRLILPCLAHCVAKFDIIFLLPSVYVNSAQNKIRDGEHRCKMGSERKPRGSDGMMHL